MPATNELQVEEVAAAFDGVARDFEETLENDITRAFRQRVYETIRSLVPTGSRILDINCGIGIDAVSLAQQGYRTSGLDISAGMIAQARERTKNAGTGSVEFFTASFDDLSMFSSGSFDLVLSNFGGLNCASSLTQCAAEVARVVRPGGYFVAVVMPRVSMWEVVAGISRLNFRWGFRRFAREVQATGFRGESFVVHYHPLSALKRSCRDRFIFEHARGLNIISPPPHATTFSQSFPRFCHLLESVDRSLSSWPLIRSVGDHYVAVFRRRPHGSSSGTKSE